MAPRRFATDACELRGQCWCSTPCRLTPKEVWIPGRGWVTIAPTVPIADARKRQEGTDAGE